MSGLWRGADYRLADAPSAGPIYRDFGLAICAPHPCAARVEGTILVQAAPTEAETAFMLDVTEGLGAGARRRRLDRTSMRIDAVARIDAIAGPRAAGRSAADGAGHRR